VKFSFFIISPFLFLKIPKISKELVKDLWQIYGKGRIRTTSLYLRQVAEYFIHENKSRYDKKPNVTFHRRSAG